MIDSQTVYASNALSRLLRLMLIAAASLVLAGPADAHQLWIETEPTAKPGQPHEIEVCWGHSSERATGESLGGQRDKLRTLVMTPDGKRVDLHCSQHDDHFASTTTPEVPGYHTFGSELQTGIIPRPLHDIPANTRIVMVGKTLTRVAGSEEGLTNAIGFDLEIVPLTSSAELRRGGVARAKLLLHGKPLGGKNVEISMATAGTEPLPEHRRIQSHEWSIEATPDPYNGEVAFPLIAGGKHVFAIRYFDETPGTYDGPRDDDSEFSHLRKGDTYERTMYVSTLTIWVAS